MLQPWQQAPPHQLMRTMPALTSFWILAMICGLRRWCCEALGFSCRSLSTCARRDGLQP